VRTAFHDAVARFGGLGTRSERALSSRRVIEWREPRLTPLSLFGVCVDDKENARTVEPRPTHLASRERYGATPVRDAFTLASRRRSDGEPREPSSFHDRSLSLAAMGAPEGRCRSLGHRGGDATQHVIRSHSRTLESSRTMAAPSREHRPTNNVCRIAPASTCFRTRPSAPVKSDSPRSPFIAARGYTQTSIGGRVWRLRAT
jgi:hypothetical protein